MIAGGGVFLFCESRDSLRRQCGRFFFKLDEGMRGDALGLSPWDLLPLLTSFNDLDNLGGEWAKSVEGMIHKDLDRTTSAGSKIRFQDIYPIIVYTTLYRNRTRHIILSVLGSVRPDITCAIAGCRRALYLGN